MIRQIITAEAFKRATEYREGDIVQIKPDGFPHSGRLGVIIGISTYKQRPAKDDSFSYRIKLSDRECISAPCHRIKLIREAESNEDLPENKSQFLPDRSYYPDDL